MKLTAEIGAQAYELAISGDHGRVSAEVAGRQYEFELRGADASEYVLISKGHVYECRVERSRDLPDGFVVHLNDTDYTVNLIDPKRLRSAQGSSGQGHGSAKVVAPMPGKIVRLLVAVGAQVEAGAGIVVVEAMKMQNELRSPRAGTVTALHADPGTTVNAGDVLATIE